MSPEYTWNGVPRSIKSQRPRSDSGHDCLNSGHDCLISGYDCLTHAENSDRADVGVLLNDLVHERNNLKGFKYFYLENGSRHVRLACAEFRT